MTEFELISNFQNWQHQLKQLGYNVSAMRTGFFIHNHKGSIVADVQTVDGLRGFAQGIEYSNFINKQDDKSNPKIS